MNNKNEQENFNDQYRERLKKVIGKKFDTVTIFPLSVMESAFGEIWGHGLLESELTSEQKMARAKWVQCRTNILNNGNHQKRNTMVELDQHDVKKHRYHIDFIPVNKQILEDEEDFNK